jgi:predicted ATPase
LVALNAWARNIRGYFFLDPRTMRSSSRGGDGDIGEAGNRLAAFVHHLRRYRKDAFDRLVRRVQHYYKPLIALTTRQHGPGWATIEVTERWGSEEATFNARQVSDGLLRLIAVAALYELDPAPSVVLLDEIENGLHPHLLGAVVEMLQEFVDEREDRSQVIFTTHSPITINFVRDPSQVLLVHRLPKKGTAKVTPLNETRDFDRLREAFDLGELWYNAGEELLTKPRRKARRR